MSDLNYTQTRHFMLRLVEPGDTVERFFPTGKAVAKYEKRRGFLAGTDARALREMGDAGLLAYTEKAVGFGGRSTQCVGLSDSGRALLAAWDEQRGKVGS